MITYSAINKIFILLSVEPICQTNPFACRDAVAWSFARPRNDDGGKSFLCISGLVCLRVDAILTRLKCKRTSVGAHVRAHAHVFQRAGVCRCLIVTLQSTRSPRARIEDANVKPDGGSTYEKLYISRMPCRSLLLFLLFHDVTTTKPVTAAGSSTLDTCWLPVLAGD